MTTGSFPPAPGAIIKVKAGEDFPDNNPVSTAVLAHIHERLCSIEERITSYNIELSAFGDRAYGAEASKEGVTQKEPPTAPGAVALTTCKLDDIGDELNRLGELLGRVIMLA